MSLRRFTCWLCGCLCWVAAPLLARTLIDAECEVGARPSCTVPLARVVSPMQLHTASVPTPSLPEVDACSLPRATCSQPAAATFLLGHCCVQTVSAPSAADVLRIWEQSAAARHELSDSERSWMARLNEPQLSPHALATAVRLLGPVSREGVLAEFDWKLKGPSVEGVPRDQAGRLFCPRLRVTLNPVTNVVAELQVGLRDGGWVTVKRPEPMEDAIIELTGFESAASNDSRVLPPSPEPQRLADAIESSVVR